MSALGTTVDPKILIPGTPEAIEENARVLRARGERAEAAGEGLRRINTGAWTGPAASAFHDKFADEPVKWLKSADSLGSAADVLDQYADTLRWAQKQAEEAIRLWNEGQNATAQAKNAHDAALKQVTDQNRANAAAGNPTCFTVPAFSDPGAATRQAAQETLASARRQLNDVGNDTAGVLRIEAATAPDESSWLEDTLDFAGDFAEGVWDEIVGLAETAWAVLPVKAIWDPVGHVDGLKTMAQNALHNITHPTEFVKEALNLDEWTNGDAGRVLGGIVGGAGVGKAAKILDGPGGKGGEGTEKPKPNAKKSDEQIALVSKTIEDDNGRFLGYEDSTGVRMISEQELNQIREQLHANLGAPTQSSTSTKGYYESWLISDKPRINVTYRTYSDSGGATIDLNNFPNATPHRFHIIKG